MFYFLAEWTGQVVSQVNFVVCLASSFIVGIVFRVFLDYKSTSVTVRRVYSALFGILFCTICFERSIIWLLLFAFGSYCVLSFKRDTVQWYMLIYCYVCVCSYHLYLIIYFYEVHYEVDLSYPLMVLMQRMTYVCFSYHDGSRKFNELNEDQRKIRIVEKPSLIEYFSYLFSFFSVICGPTSTYADYDEMITGRNFENHLKDGRQRPSFNVIPVVKKLIGGIVCLLVYLIGDSFRLVEHIVDPSLAFHHRLFYITLMCFTVRCRYYFVWLTVESVSNVAGLGFNGFDEKGNEKWDLVTNIDIVKCEFGSFHDRTVAFNSLTASWLRRIAYNRFNNYRFWITYGMSALWHGFFPGCHLLYIVILIGLQAARKIHSNFSPYIEHSWMLERIYSFLSFLCRTIVLDFAQLSYMFLIPEKIFNAWRYYYLSPLIVSAVIVLTLPRRKRTKDPKAE